jgi:hypothetical protein
MLISPWPSRYKGLTSALFTGRDFIGEVNIGLVIDIEEG